jgi:hypothetical protein
LVVVPVVGTHDGWAHLAALAWMLGVLATLWLVARDIRAATSRPVPLTPTAERRANPFDLGRTAALGLAVGLTIAFLLGDSTCSWRQPDRSNGTSSSAQTGSQSGSPSGPPTDSPGGPASPGDSSGSQFEPPGSIEIGQGSGDAAGQAQTPGTAQSSPQNSSAEQDPPWGWLLVGLVALCALVAALVWLARRHRPPPRTPRTWAEDVAARLDHEGSRRGRGRERAETVVAHTEALAHGPIPDARLVSVGQVVSAALFGRAEPPEATRQWAEHVVDEASAAHPPTARRARHRR